MEYELVLMSLFEALCNSAYLTHDSFSHYQFDVKVTMLDIGKITEIDKNTVPNIKYITV